MKKWAPYLMWAFAIALLFFLFRQSPPKDVWETLRRSHYVLFGALALAYFLANYLLDVFTLKRVFSLHGYPMRLSALFSARAESYPYAVLHYNASQGIFAYRLKKMTKLPLKIIGVITFYTMLVDLFVFVVMATIGLWCSDLYRDPLYRLFSAGLLVFCTLTLTAVSLKHLFLRFPPLYRRFHHMAWYQHLYRYPLQHGAQVFLLRGLYVLLVTLGLYLPFLAFDTHFVSNSAAWSFVYKAPLVQIIGAVPITPAGLGTINSAYVYLFKNIISSPAILEGHNTAETLLLSMTLTWSFANLALKTAAGFLLRVIRRIRAIS